VADGNKFCLRHADLSAPLEENPRTRLLPDAGGYFIAGARIGSEGRGKIRGLDRGPRIQVFLLVEFGGGIIFNRIVAR